MGTLDGGLAKFDGISSTGWTIYNTSNSDLPKNNVYSLLESSSGDIFVGTTKSVSKFDGNSNIGWTNFNNDNSDLQIYPSENVYSLIEDDNNDIFIGTTEGLFKFDGSSFTDWTIYNYNNIPQSSSNYTLLKTTNGEILIGAYNQGLSILTLASPKASFIPPSENICVNNVAHFVNTTENSLSNQWKLDGSNTSITADLYHTFTEAGQHIVSLNITDSQGCEDTHNQTITVYNNAADLDLGEDIAECQNNNVILEAGLNDMDTYSWHLNETEIGTTASITATQSGTYTLFVTDMCGNTNSDTINVIIEDDCVWPGDTNYDYIVNHKDLLPIGLGFGTSGFSRPNASFNWEGQACQDWGNVQLENGIDYKHIDTNGDGMIDSNDALAITINYDKTHNPILTTPNDNNSFISLETELTSSNIFEPTSTNFVVIDLMLKENEDNQGLAAYGLAFDLEYNIPSNLASINNVSVHFEDSWIGSPNELLTIWKHLPEQNKIELGLTRINHQNALGQGKVGEVIVEIDIEVVTFDEIALDFTTSNIDMVLSNNTFVPVNENTATFNFTNDACNTPTNLHETDLTCNSVTLNWSAVSNAEAYILAGRKASGDIKVFPEIQNNFRTFNGGLQTNTTYQWSVKAKCNGIWTDYAPITSFITPSCKNSNYDASKDPFLNETTVFFSQINLYPNPAKNNLNISFTSFEEENISIKVVDILGKTVLTKEIEVLQGENNFNLNIETLQKGIYFLEIGNSLQRDTQEFLVM